MRSCSDSSTSNGALVKLLTRKNCLDDDLVRTLQNQLDKFKLRDCLKVLSLSGSSPHSESAAVDIFVVQVQQKLKERLSTDLSEISLVVSSLGRLGLLGVLQSVADSLEELLAVAPTGEWVQNLDSKDSVNVLNVLTRLKIRAPKTFRAIINQELTNLKSATLDHRLGSLLITSMARCGLKDRTGAVESWCTSQLESDWSAQSLSLFIYSVWKVVGPKGTVGLIRAQLGRADLTQFTNQNLCTALVGLAKLSGLRDEMGVLFGELDSRIVKKNDLFFLVRHRAVASYALARLMKDPSLSMKDLVVLTSIADVTNLSSELLPKILPLSGPADLPNLFFLLNKTGGAQIDIDWTVFVPYPESVSGEIACAMLQTIAKQDLVVPLPLLDWVVTSLMAASSLTSAQAVLALLSLHSLHVRPGAFTNACIFLISKISTLNSVDLRQLRRTVQLMDDRVLLQALLAHPLQLTTDAIPTSVRPSPGQQQVCSVLKKKILTNNQRLAWEVPVDSLGSSIDIVVGEPLRT